MKSWINKTLLKVKETKIIERTETNKSKKVEKKVVETIHVPRLTDIPKINLNILPDYDLLFSLLNMRTYSKSPLQDVLISNLEAHFLGRGAITSKDKYGNLYVIKGQADFYPCVVAHTDINQQVRNNVSIQKAYPWIFGFDADKGEQAGMGADDKVGVYFAMHMFDLFDNIKLFFPKDEEIGLVGTYEANQNFFSDCSMLVQLDRNSYKNDLVTYTNGIEVCSDEFVEAAKSIMDKYMYSSARGSCTDIGGIKKFKTVNCVAMNVSCGYIDEHSSEELISVPHFENAINFAYELLQLGVDKVWTHTSKSESYTYSSYPYGSYYSSGYYSDFDELPAPSSKDKFVVSSPVGILEIDKEYSSQDSYLFEIYPELMDSDYRASYLSHSGSDLDCLSYDDQDYIDDCLQDGMCPCCYNPVKPITNRLMLYTECSHCDAMFNIPMDNAFDIDEDDSDQTKIEFYENNDELPF